MIRKTDDQIILQMLEQGKLQKEIAQHFGVSPVAIHKRVKRLQPIKEPKSFQNLTRKEKLFSLEIAEGKTQTQAAMNSFDVTTRDSAKSLGSELMAKSDIQMAVSELMQSEGLTRRYRVQKLKSHIDHADPNVSLKGLDQSWKLDGAYTETHVNYVLTYADIQKSIKEIEEEIRKEKAKLGIDVIEGEVVEEGTEETEEEEDTEESEEKDTENR